MHESGGTNPWDHTPRRTPMGMMGMSLPRLETMQRENEIGELEYLNWNVISTIWRQSCPNCEI